MNDKLVRFGVAMEESLLVGLDRLVEARSTTRSEALRDLVRAELSRSFIRSRSHAVAALTLVYNHHVRDLSDRLTEMQHQLGGSVRSTMHVHLDAELCLEVIVLTGRADQLAESRGADARPARRHPRRDRRSSPSARTRARRTTPTTTPMPTRTPTALRTSTPSRPRPPLRPRGRSPRRARSTVDEPLPARPVQRRRDQPAAGLIIGVFVVSWIVSIAYYRFRKYDELTVLQG